MVGLGIVSSVGQDSGRLDPRVVGHGLLDRWFQHGRVALVSRSDYEVERDAVGCVGNQVHLVAEAPFSLAFLGPGAVLDTPAGVRVGNGVAVRVGVSLEERGVNGEHLSETRQWLRLSLFIFAVLECRDKAAKLVSDLEQAVLDDVRVVCKAGDEPAEGAFDGDLVPEAA